MPKQRRNYCRRCNRSRDDGPISRAGYCEQCSHELAVDARRQVADKAGPVFDRWQAGIDNPRSPVGRPETPYTPGV